MGLMWVLALQGALTLGQTLVGGWPLIMWTQAPLVLVNGCAQHSRRISILWFQAGHCLSKYQIVYKIKMWYYVAHSHLSGALLEVSNRTELAKFGNKYK